MEMCDCTRPYVENNGLETGELREKGLANILLDILLLSVPIRSVRPARHRFPLRRTEQGWEEGWPCGNLLSTQQRRIG